MKKGIFIRMLKDDSGLHSVEIALGIALIAAVAGFGMITMGDAIATFFDTTGASVSPGADIPGQGDSTFCGADAACTPPS